MGNLEATYQHNPLEISKNEPIVN